MRSLLAVSLGALVVAPDAAAQEILLTGPLAGAPAFIPSSDWRAGRLELALSPGVSLGSNDAPALLAGGEAHYFPWDRLGAGIWGAAAFPMQPNETELRAAVSPELVFVPIVGKANSFDHAYFRFDLHLLGGAAFVAASNANGENETSWVPELGLGFRGFSARWFSNSLDYRLLLGEPVRHVVTVSFSFWVFPVRDVE